MIENLTPAQQVFSVFYAIFFGIMLQTIGARRTNAQNQNKTKKNEEFRPDITLNLFDTPNVWEIGFCFNNRPFWRFCSSIVFLNIIPAVVFAVVFLGLSKLCSNLNLIQVLILVWISLTPSYIYRIYLGILAKYIDYLYLDEKTCKNNNRSDLEARTILVRDRKKNQGHKSILNHLAIPILWIFPSFILLYHYFLISTQINNFLILISWIFFIVGIILFIFPELRRKIWTWWFRN